MDNLDKKVDRLKENLRSMESAVVAFSGGVDSTYLLAIAHEIMGDTVLGVTVLSEFISSFEMENTKDLIKKLGIPHTLLEADIMSSKEVVENPPDRCYHCKKDIFASIINFAKSKSIVHMLEGSNLDDAKAYRPGKKALHELGIASPLLEAQLTKSEIRELSKRMNLPTWNKPPEPCLATRFPYGVKITTEALSHIEKAEHLLHELGFEIVRVRHHDTVARIEVADHEIEKLFDSEIRSKVIDLCKEIGYTYIAVDIEGYRSGSMDEFLNKEQLSG